MNRHNTSLRPAPPHPPTHPKKGRAPLPRVSGHNCNQEIKLTSCYRGRGSPRTVQHLTRQPLGKAQLSGTPKTAGLHHLASIVAASFANCSEKHCMQRSGVVTAQEVWKFQPDLHGLTQVAERRSSNSEDPKKGKLRQVPLLCLLNLNMFRGCFRVFDSAPVVQRKWVCLKIPPRTGQCPFAFLLTTI